MCVLITDGRANISLARSNEDPAALLPDAPRPSSAEIKEEVLDMARKMLGANMQLLVIDTENKYLSGTGFAQEIAEAANGRYWHIPNASDLSIAAAASIWAAKAA